MKKCVMYGLRCMMYGLRCMMYDLKCMMYGLRCMMYDVWCIKSYIIHCTSYIDTNTGSRNHVLRIAYFSFFIFHFSLLGQGGLYSQTLQVATKTIEKSFDKIEEVRIQAERADIEVVTWNRPEIKLTVELTAKHPDRNTATNDLKTVQFTASQTNNILYINNYVLITKDITKPQSNLKAHYILQLPATVSLFIIDSFGKIMIRGLTKSTTLKTQFCNVDISDSRGKINTEIHFGELRLTNIDANTNLVTDHTDAWLKQIAGFCKIRAKNGIIEIDTDKSEIDFDIKTDKAEVRYSPAFTIKN